MGNGRLVVARRIVAGGTVAMLSAFGVSTVASAAPSPASARPVFQLPFACGETGWWAIGRAAHGTSQNRWPLDINRGSGDDDRGHEVVASAAGTVLQAGGDSYNTVKIGHGDGWSTIYRHMDGLAVQTGQPVNAGTVIGHVSDVGSPGSVHLHFEQLLNGTVVQSYFDGQAVPDLAIQGRHWFAASANCNGPVVPPPARPWVHLSNASVSGASTFASFQYGNAGDQLIRGDWDGNGTQTVGVFREGHWYLNNQNDNSAPEVEFGYGNPGDVALAGDWDGDGVDTPGVFRAGWWYLSNDFAGSVHAAFRWGNPSGDTPVVGDWDGNGTDTPGLVRGNEWIYNNTLSDYTHGSFIYGNVGDAPAVGDWDGNGTDTPAVVRAGIWYLNNGLDGSYEVWAVYGNPGDTPFPGNWDGVGGDGFGVLRY